MARVLITGSSEGLGLLAGRRLAAQGHGVVLRARNAVRADAARRALPEAEAVLVGDLSALNAMRDVADQANCRSRFDAVIHNVGIGEQARRIETPDGLSPLWAVNVLAPLRAHGADAPPRPAHLPQLPPAPERRPEPRRPPAARGTEPGRL